MNIVIVSALLMGFSVCVIVGLVTVLQSLINQEPTNGVRQGCQGSMLPDRAAER